MAFIGKIFRKKNAEPTPQDAVNKLRETELLLVKKQEYLENKIDTEIATAKKHGVKNKRLALQALKRKKQYEKQLQQVDATLSTLEFQRAALENATTNKEIIKTMDEAAKAFKVALKNLDIDEIHQLMDDIAEQQDLANEITEAISNPFRIGQEIDEDELLAELEDLEHEDEHIVELPSAPKDELPVKPARKKKITDDDDMAQLQAWVNA